jgi:hypothetical protein
MCAGSIPVRSTNGNDVTQVVTLVCKTRAFGRCEFESRHSHKMKILDFLIQVGLFKSKGEAIRAIKGKITLKINDIEINESHLDGDIFIEEGKFYITNFNTQKILDIRNNSLSL